MSAPQPAARALDPRLIVSVVIAIASVVLLVLLLARTGAAEEPTASNPLDLTVALDPVASGFDNPVQLVGAGDGTGHRYIVEKIGRVARLLPDGSIDDEYLIDISDRVLNYHERGLLGLAFHPDFAENRRFYLAYSFNRSGSTVVSEFTVPGEPEPPKEGEEPVEPRPVELTEKHLLVLAQPFTTHKAGMLDFDPDGMLLISTGDGGAAYDPFDHSLDPNSLLGKILRIDVDDGWPYGIPDDNGFSHVPEARGEVHAIGLRNPYRFSQDPASGHLYIADVGQAFWEEVNVLRRGDREVSFGWNQLEGEGCLLEKPCVPEDHTAPALVFPHVFEDEGFCAIIGGHVYRGAAGTLPDGAYLYGDYCSGTIWAVPVEQLLAGTPAPAVVARHDPTDGQIIGFGRDDDGEVYVTTSAGDVMHIRAVDADVATAG